MYFSNYNSWYKIQRHVNLKSLLGWQNAFLFLTTISGKYFKIKFWCKEHSKHDWNWTRFYRIVFLSIRKRANLLKTFMSLLQKSKCIETVTSLIGQNPHISYVEQLIHNTQHHLNMRFITEYVWNTSLLSLCSYYFSYIKFLCLINKITNRNKSYTKIGHL